MTLTNRVMNPRHYFRNLLLFFLATLSLALTLTGLGLSYSRAMNLVHPRRAEIRITPAHYGLRWEDVSFKSSDGLALRGWFIPPRAESGNAVIIYVHGLGANREQHLPEAALLARSGYGALLFDLRHHGESEGNVSTMGHREVEDVRGAIAYLLTRVDVDPARIGVMGHSLGGGIAIRAAARVPEIRAVIAASAFSSLEENIADGVQALTGLPSFPFAPLVIFWGEREANLRLADVRPIDDIAQISPRAVLLIHGARDGVVPVENAYRLFAAARAPKALHIIANAAHAGLMDANPGEYEKQVAGFWKQYLK